MKIGIKPIIGGAEDSWNPILWETVRYNSRYTTAPYAPYGAESGENFIGSQFIRIYLLCLLQAINSPWNIKFLYVKEVVSHKATYLSYNH